MQRAILFLFAFVAAQIFCLAQSPTTSTTAQADPPWMKRLKESPRHHEWAEITHGGRTLHAFVVYPEVSDKAPVVVIIHENQGLNDWARGIADQIAEAGYIAVAPDMLSGMAPGGGKTSDFESNNAARDAIGKLNQMPDQVTADLNATVDYARKLLAANGKVGVAGFCWGGGQAFKFATNREDLDAVYVFYGSAPGDDAAYAKIKAPIYGFYGENDARINSALPEVEAKMKAAGKTFQPVIYAGAGHGFMRQGETAEPGTPNATAKDDAWKRWKELLANLK